MRLLDHNQGARFAFTSLMNFVDFTVFNAGAAEATNINAGGVDVPAGTSLTATLTNAELLTLCQVNGIAVMQVGASDAEKSAAAALIAQGTALETAVAAAEAAEAGGITLHREQAWAALNSDYSL